MIVQMREMFALLLLVIPVPIDIDGLFILLSSKLSTHFSLILDQVEPGLSMLQNSYINDLHQLRYYSAI
jgi:hypothetical protein